MIMIKAASLRGRLILNTETVCYALDVQTVIRASMPGWSGRKNPPGGKRPPEIPE
jgi:hypothetical protein